MILKTFDIPNAMYGFVTMIRCTQDRKAALQKWVVENHIPCTVIDSVVNHSFFFKNESDRLLFLLSNKHE